MLLYFICLILVHELWHFKILPGSSFDQHFRLIWPLIFSFRLFFSHGSAVASSKTRQQFDKLTVHRPLRVFQYIRDRQHLQRPQKTHLYARTHLLAWSLFYYDAIDRPQPHFAGFLEILSYNVGCFEYSVFGVHHDTAEEFFLSLRVYMAVDAMRVGTGRWISGTHVYSVGKMRWETWKSHAEI